MEDAAWLKQENPITKLNNDVHIWLIRFNQSEHIISESDAILSAEEKKRAKRFHFPIDQKRFSVTRTLLKKKLSGIINLPAPYIVFSFSKFGKPELESKSPKIYFNVSHSGNLGLVAISDLGPIGIDVEQFRSEMTTADIAKRFFSKAEIESYLSLPEDQKLQGFFNCWSRKEAFIKAVGKGLSLPLHTFDVSLRPDEHVKLLAVRGQNEDVHSWQLVNLKTDTNYAAAYIVKAQSFSTYYWDSSV
jgi:4'-phosphopantetheinyl transferase